MIKTNGLILLAALALFSFSSCKKDSSSSVPTSTWTLASTNYTAQHTVTVEVDDSQDKDDGEDFVIDASTGDGANVVSLTFKDRPTKSGTYMVLPFMGSSIGTSPTGCFILGGNSTLDVSSIGKAGDVVNVTVSGGTITATFSNVSTEDFSTSSQQFISGSVSVRP